MDGETIMITGKDYMVEMKRLQDEIERLLADIDTKNGIIQLHQTIEAKHKAEIAELVDMLDKAQDLIEFHTKHDGVLCMLINWAKKARKLIAKHKGE